MVYIGYNVGKWMVELCGGRILGNEEDDGVMGGNGRDDLMEIVDVNVVWEGGGIWGRSVDERDVVRELNGDEGVVREDLGGVLGLCDGVVDGIVG